MQFTHSLPQRKRWISLTLILAIGISWLIAPLNVASSNMPLPKSIPTGGAKLPTKSLAEKIAPSSSPLAASTVAQPAALRASEVYGKLPISFESNQGQLDNSVKFFSHGNGYGLYLSAAEATFILSKVRHPPATAGGADSKPRHPLASVSGSDSKPTSVMSMKLADANPNAEVEGLDRLGGVSNYFIGNDPAQWRANIPNYGRVRVRAVYPGIDIIYYGHGRQLEYDLVVAPGADLNAIRLEFRGARKLRLSPQGDILLKSHGGDILMRSPNVYQEVDGQKIPVRGAFVRVGKKQIGFRVEGYDPSKPLTIDPTLTLAYSTLLGGSNTDFGVSIAVDSAGNAYVTGKTYSTNFPLQNAFQSTMSGTSVEAYDAFVSKLSADGSSLIYSTYLGGSDNNEDCDGIAVDSAGNAYVMGVTMSNNFPTTANALQPTSVQGNFIRQVFVSKLSASGSSLLYSTYLSTTNSTELPKGGIAVDAFGNAYVTGTTDSPSFPVKNAFQSAFVNGGDSAFITKLDTTASGADSLVYSSYLGGATGFPSDSEGNSVAVDANGNAYIAGITEDPNFPTRNAFQPAISPPGSGHQTLDAFLTKINTNASGNDSLLYSTFLGGSDHEREAYVAADQAGNVYITGKTFSTNFPTKNPFQPTNTSPNNSAFVTKLDTTASGANSLVYSTYLGGSGGNSANSIAVDSNGDVYIAGIGDIPQVNPLPVAPADRFSFLAKLNSDGSDLIYSTFFWGVINDLALDSAKNAYVTGIQIEDGTNFPTTPGAFQTQPAGEDAFISKLSFTEATGLTISSITPNRGGDTGFVTPTIKGTGFAPGATVKLTMPGQTDIVGNPVTVRADGRAITVRFDLHGVAVGAWDVSVTNPGSPTVTLPASFTVEAGSVPRVWVDLVGRNVIRPNQEGGFVIFYGNSGNTDAEGVPLMISGIPKDADVRLDFNLKPTPLPPEFERYRSDDISPVITTSTEKVIPLFVGVIPAGGTRAFRILVTPHNQPLTSFTLQTTVGDPFFGSPLKKKPEDCYKAVAIFIMKKIAEKLLKRIFPLEECARAEAEAFSKISLATVEAASTSGTGGLDAAGGIAALSGMLGPALKATIECAEQEVGIIVPEIGVAIFILELIPDLYDAFKIGEDCSEAFAPEPPKELLVTIVRAHDPNDKVGSRGAGPPQYLTGDQPLRYAIFFENQPTATAPAQTVVINDQLDPSKVDLSTFSLGPIAVGNQVVNPPAGISEFSTDVDLRPANNIIARINVALNQSSALITWRFQSIDPATGQPTTDPLAGFLPPNNNPPEGEGDVLFTIMPKTTLVTGTQVQNQAAIVFDDNNPINTPVWTNTIDKTKPASQVMPLAGQQTSTNFTVQWSGSDADSGIEGFNIYVSENGGPYTVWLRDATGNWATFIGQPLKTYSFYSIAQDNAHNLESAKTNAEAVTTTPPSASQFSAASYDVVENAGTAFVTVTRMGNTSNAATVDYATSNGTAISGRDYTSVSGTLSFAAGETVKDFPIPIINNSLADGQRTIQLTLSNATGGDVISSPSTAVLHILDDDMFGDTLAGSPVTVHLGNITLIFTQVSENGSSAAEPVDPNAQGTLPGGYTAISPAYDISTNATYSGPVQVCFELDGINDQTTFSHLKVLHSEGGVLVDRTTGQNFGARLLCGNVSSLSPFVIAQGQTPTAAPGSISGFITTADGTPLGGVALQLIGAINSIGDAITDSHGRYTFETVEANGFYTVVPARANYTFSPASRSFSLVGNKTDASFTANATGVDSANPIDTPQFFVRQQYLDFLGREPDADGLVYWTGQITQCGVDADCLRQKRLDVSNAFFLEPEFQQSGAYVYRLYKAALGHQPTFTEFEPDRARVIGGANLDQNKAALALAFVGRDNFTATYPRSQTADQFVDALVNSIALHSGVNLSSQRRELIALYDETDTGRAKILKQLADNAALIDSEYTGSVVLAEYFGYLRRDADEAGYFFWLEQLNTAPLRDLTRQHALVCSFITSAEYQRRFSAVMTHSNAECGR